MFWIKESDDYQSRVAYGNALAAQYRFKEAVDVYKKALKIHSDDWKIQKRLAGAELTLRRFDEAMPRYYRCFDPGADIKSIVFPLGIGHYLQKNYVKAVTWFEKCLPTDDEMAVAVIYWHALSCYRHNRKSELLDSYHRDMNVGHHTAYQLAVSVFCGKSDYGFVLDQLKRETDELNYIIQVGLC